MVVTPASVWDQAWHPQRLPHRTVLQWGLFPGKYGVFLHRLLVRLLLEIL